MAISPSLLNHLQHLTEEISTKSGVFYIDIYSKKIKGEYMPIPAVAEGVACVDDVARAVVLALEVYENSQNKGALELAEKWLTFLEYMQDRDGLMTNFIYSKKGERKYDIPSSYKGGAWWSSRAKWAWAKAYKVTGNKDYLDLYKKTKITEKYHNDVAAILLLAAFEIPEAEDEKNIQNLVSTVSTTVSPKGYLVHSKGGPLHMWAYHELEAIAKAYALYKDKRLLKICQDTVNKLVRDVIEDGFYFEYSKKDKSEINPYCVSPLVRGLYELYLVDKNKEYLGLMNKCFDWFKKVYDPNSGRCFDWISDGKVSRDCGAEAAIEAGFSYIRQNNL